MPYPEEICKPMREDLTNVGFVELKNAEQVSDLLYKFLKILFSCLSMFLSIN